MALDITIYGEISAAEARAAVAALEQMHPGTCDAVALRIEQEHLATGVTIPPTKAYVDAQLTDPAAVFGDDTGDDDDHDLVTPAPDLVPAQAIPVPVAAAPLPHPVTGVIERDVTGLTYDARIHSNPPAKTQDNKWRRRRGVPNDLVIQVETELRAANPAPQATAGAPPVAPAPATSVSAPPAPPATPAPPASSPPAPAPPLPAPVPDELPTPTAPAPPPSTPTPAALEFHGCMKRVGELQTAGKIAPAAVTATVQQLGLTSIAELFHRPDQIPGFMALIEAAAAA